MREGGMAGVVVDVRVREDPLRSVIKALGVPHVEACGDALDFISKACCRAKSMMGGKTPVSVLGLREADSLVHVYGEALALACERRMCHVVVEVHPGTLYMAGAADWRRPGVYALVVMRGRVAGPVRARDHGAGPRWSGAPHAPPPSSPSDAAERRRCAGRLALSAACRVR
ncbi:hypothetical protein NXY56_006418 [Leishmania guyanensis]